MRANIGLPVRLLVVAIAAAVTATLAPVSPAQADSPDVLAVASSQALTIETQGQQLDREADARDRAVEALEPYVSRSEADGTFLLDAPDPLIERIGSEQHQEILDGMAFVNGLIRSGTHISTPDLTAVPPELVGVDDVGILHHGVNSYSCGWVNCTLRLDRENTDNLLALLAIGVGTAGVIAFICALSIVGLPTCSAIAGLAAAIITIGGGVIALCANSHGVWIRYGLGSWCGGQ